MTEKNILNLGCGMETYGNYRVDMLEPPKSVATHVFDISKGLQFSDNFFDEVRSRNYLEHDPNTGFHLNECFRVLKRGGIVDITTDNAECTRYYWFGTHTGRYEKLHPGDKHYCIFTASHLKNHFEHAGFTNIQISYVKTDTLGRYIDMVLRFKPRIRILATKP
jgi:predicted SAM-dependent methyltransferase